MPPQANGELGQANGQISGKSLFDAFLDYFQSPHDEEDIASSGKTSSSAAKFKSLIIRSKIKQHLENMPFDYTTLFEETQIADASATQFFRSTNVYELIRNTK